MTHFVWFFTIYFAILCAGTSVVIHPATRLIWNATASTPVGLYRLQSVSPLHVGDLIVIRPPADIARMLARGGYLPLGVPLLKPVAALSGQSVCRICAAVTVDGMVLGKAWRCEEALGMKAGLLRLSSSGITSDAPLGIL